MDNSGSNFSKLLKKEQELLVDVYGKDVETQLKSKLKQDTELIFEYIHFDDNIDTIQKKILIHLSNDKEVIIDIKNIVNKPTWRL